MFEPDDLSLEILGALASDPNRLGRFIDLTGLRADTIRQASQTQEFWIALYDHIASDEALLIEIAREINQTPQAIMLAYNKLAPPTAFE